MSHPLTITFVQESLHEEKQRSNLGPRQQRDCTSIEQLEPKERHTRQIAMSRVLVYKISLIFNDTKFYCTELGARVFQAIYR